MKRINRQKTVKGTSRAVALSILIHAGLFLLAGMLVVFTVVKKEEQVFESPKAVERPKMKLKKPRVSIKKSSRPKSTTRIVTRKRSAMPVIALPEMGGLGDGLGEGLGGGFDMMPELDEISVFGGTQSIGNDFEGVVYSLLRDRKGGLIPMDRDQFRDILRKYVLSGWDNSILARYYQCPKKLYTTHFMVPRIPTALAPAVFGNPNLEEYYLFAKYEGKLVYPEDIRMRFWGVGDAYIFVNVGGKEVLMSAWHFHHPWFFWWTSMAGGDRTYMLGNQLMVVGDWIELKAGEPVDMKVLFGEWLGGSVAGMLLVEVDGEDYPSSRHNGPLLPAFKTAELSWDTLTEITKFLADGECSLTNGPIFNDYHDPARPPTPLASLTVLEPEPEAEPSAEPFAPTAMRDWSLADGKAVQAQFVTRVGRNALLETSEGRQFKVPLEKLSDEDNRMIRLASPPALDIEFSKTTTKRKFGPTHEGNEPPVRGSFYTFAVRIKQTSIQPYGLGLTAEYFAIGDEIGGNKRMLLEHRTEDFSLIEENEFSFEFSGEPVELLDYNINYEHRGQRYGGYLAIVRDRLGQIIAHKTSSDNLFEIVDNLRKLKEGWYFDKEGKPCLPTAPRAQTAPSNFN
jgi:hypothetical protein